MNSARRPHRLRPYALAVALVGLVASTRALLDPLIGDPGEFALFYLIVAITAYLGGLGPGLFATALSTIAVDIYFMGPSDTFAIAKFEDWVRHGAFLVGGVGISVICESLLQSRDRAREALVELERERRLLNVTLTSIGDAVITTDERGRVTFLNPIAESLTGWLMADAIDKPVEDVLTIINEETREAVESLTTQILRDGAILGLANHTLLRSRNGDEIPIDDSGAPIRGSDQTIRGVILVFRDISERRQAELRGAELLARERAARAEAERANQAKDDFLATLSHELRTPLNAILGWSQLLRSAKLDPKLLERGLEVIDRNSRVQTQLIEDLLDMSRIASGKTRLEVRSIELLPVIDSAMEALRPAAKAKAISVSRSIAPGAMRLKGDPARLQQVAWNLLSNAIKFTPAGGSVWITASLCGSQVEITITDTGQGISKDFLPHVFERFRQADSSPTRRHGGLGLGLAIVRNLVELHGGSVRASSHGEGKGSTFYVKLPADTTPASDNPKDAVREGDRLSRADEMQLREPPNLAGVKVLLIEDDKDARELFAQILSERRAIVRAAATAASGLAEIIRERHDVLLCDIGMPGEDGYSLMRKVRALGAAAGGSIPAIALTAFAGPDDRRRAMLAGFQVHLPKPVDPSELAAAVANLAGRVT